MSSVVYPEFAPEIIVNMSIACLQLSRIIAEALNSSEENFGELIVACGDGPKVLEFIEEALDEVGFAVERKIAIPRGLAIGLWRNHLGDCSPRERVDQRISVISFICNQGIWIGAIDQLLRAGQIVCLPWGDYQFDGIAQCIDERVDFGR
jgi:hypothetical protein